METRTASEDTMGNASSVTVSEARDSNTTMSLAGKAHDVAMFVTVRTRGRVEHVNKFFCLQDPFVCVRVTVIIMKKHSAKHLQKACSSVRFVHE